jgi:glutamyl-tRNA synthetase
MDMKGRKLSKRDGDVDIHSFRKAGYLPEALVNFIALLGWASGDNREKYTLGELCQVFSVERLGKTNAKFDRDKLLAFNTDAVAAATPERLLAAFKDYLAANPELPIPAGDDALLTKLLAACKGFRTFPDIVDKCGILFLDATAVQYDPKAVEKVLAKNDGEGFAMLAELQGVLAGCEWAAAALEKLLAELCERKAVGMGKVAQPIRVAVTGSTVSPDIFDTLTLLGREGTLARIGRALALR